MALVSAYDAVAPSFERHRALPVGVPEAIRSAILAQIDISSGPRLLDLGAGTGRIGWPFAAAGDDYVGVDLSFGMLSELARRAATNNGRTVRLALADGWHLPFPDATFDAVMLIHIMSAARSWEPLVTEVGRVLRSEGVLITGRTALPTDGLDARMKQYLASLFDEMDVPCCQMKPFCHGERWFKRIAQGGTRVVAATWNVGRTPRGFLDRQRTGARFSKLPEPIKEEALRRLADWAVATFGSLDALFSERYEFELQVFELEEGVGRSCKKQHGISR